MFRSFSTGMLAIATMLGGQVSANHAVAQDFSGCSCIVPATGVEQIGQIAYSSGEVLRLGDTGFAQASANQTIVADTELLSGPNGQAQVVF
ncbi:MAG: hypothetical protein AAFO77_12320, partial [Pseudomonadota bacterium]